MKSAARACIILDVPATLIWNLELGFAHSGPGKAAPDRYWPTEIRSSENAFQGETTALTIFLCLRNSVLTLIGFLQLVHARLNAA